VPLVRASINNGTGGGTGQARKVRRPSYSCGDRVNGCVPAIFERLSYTYQRDYPFGRTASHRRCRLQGIRSVQMACKLLPPSSSVLGRRTMMRLGQAIRQANQRMSWTYVADFFPCQAAEDKRSAEDFCHLLSGSRIQKTAEGEQLRKRDSGG
jgi:hypothetical protein